MGRSRWANPPRLALLVMCLALLPWSSAQSVTSDVSPDSIGESVCQGDEVECEGFLAATVKVRAAQGGPPHVVPDHNHGHGNDVAGCDTDNPGSGDGLNCPGPILPVDYSVEAKAALTVVLGREAVRLALAASTEFKDGSTANATADAGQVHNPPADEPPEPGLACRDPRGCPDLVVDAAKLAVADLTTRSFSESNCAVVEGSTEPGERRLLRFTFTTPNLGDGDLLVGSVAANPGLFVFAECHQHYHFLEYADYRLWTLDGYVDWQRIRMQYPNATAASLLAANPWLAEGFFAGHKQGFCVIDVVRYVSADAPSYRNCLTYQGISVGWADEYAKSLDGQWIDVTGLADGVYVLEAEVNAARVFAESDYSNNAGAILVALTPVDSPDVGPVPPPLPDVIPEPVKDLVRQLLGDVIEFPDD